MTVVTTVTTRAVTSGKTHMAICKNRCLLPNVLIQDSELSGHTEPQLCNA